MTVYIEYALIDNLVVDYLILKATLKITGVAPSKSRLFLCSLFASVIALVFPLINSAVISTLLKLILPVTVVALSGKFRSKKEFGLSVFLFVGVTFLLGGSASGIFSLFKIKLGSEICVALVILPCYLSAKFVMMLTKYLYRRKTLENFVYSVKVTQGEKTMELRGFLDTGNGVYDGENPVIFTTRKMAKKLFAYGKSTSVKELEVRTINGCDKKLLFTIDRIEIPGAKNKYIYNNVSVCVSDSIGDCFDLLLHPAFFMGEKENDGKVQTAV